MDTTFISIHDISQDARILYVSSSITEILGFNPEDVVGKSCWDYFHPDELPFARSLHDRSIAMDRAAVLNYCRIKSKSGRWVGCECCFTVVFDVLVGCTSIYHMSSKSQKRANDAPIIRQLFSSSPRDPRYHMLSYISSKFSHGPRPHLHEPRAALFLNRFTRTLTIMYATNGLAKILGIPASELVGKSFYFCIAENCLPEAIRCLESAKANDSIAYLRFWFRDPRQDEMANQDTRMSDGHSSDQDSDEGGVRLHLQSDAGASEHGSRSTSTSTSHRAFSSQIRGTPYDHSDSGPSSGAATDAENSSSSDRMFDRQPRTQMSSQSSLSSQQGNSPPYSGDRRQEQSIEIEAVVSCTSDGMVVVIREARPFVPDSLRAPPKIPQPKYLDGYFASPWAQEPILPEKTHLVSKDDDAAALPTLATTYLGPETTSPSAMDVDPSTEGFMRTIRDVAVFAWGLTGINGSLAQYARGQPAAGAVPCEGLPVWLPDADGMRENMPSAMHDRMQGGNCHPGEAFTVADEA